MRAQSIPSPSVTVALSKLQAGRPTPFTDGGFAAKLLVLSSFAAFYAPEVVDSKRTGTFPSCLCLFEATLVLILNLLRPNSGQASTWLACEA